MRSRLRFQGLPGVIPPVCALSTAAVLPTKTPDFWDTGHIGQRLTVTLRNAAKQCGYPSRGLMGWVHGGKQAMNTAIN